MLFCVLFGLLFVGFGLWFAAGRGMSLASGWERTPEAEKADVRLLPLCRNIGGAICLAGVIMLLAAALPGFREAGLRWAMIGWLALCVLDLFYIHRSGRYLKTGRTAGKRGGK